MNILLVNPHSPENAGDLAILQESLACLQTAFPGAAITVTINHQEPAEFLPAGASFVGSLMGWLMVISPEGSWRWRKWLVPPLGIWLILAALVYRISGLRLHLPGTSKRQLMTAYYDANLVVVFGGGHLYAHRPLNITFIWLWLGIAIGIIMGKPVVMLPQSLGPVAGTIQRRLLRWLVEQSNLVAVREYRSLALLYAAGVRQPVLVLPDLAFSTTEASAAEADAVLAPYLAGRDPQRPLLGLTVMDWGSQNPGFRGQANYEAAVVALIQHIGDCYAGDVVIFAQCFGPGQDQDDRHISRRIAAQVPPAYRVSVVDQALSPQILKAAYRQMDGMVATRMHSAIFALSAEVPTLVIGYLHKSQGIMEMLGMAEYSVDIKAASAPALCAAFDRLWRERASIQTRLQQRIPALGRTLTHLPELIRASIAQ